MNTSRYPHLIEEIGHILSGKAKLPVTLPLNDGTGMSLSLSDNMQGTWQAKYSVPVNGYVYGLPSGTRHPHVVTPSIILEGALSGLQDARHDAIGLLRQGAKDALNPRFSSLTAKDSEACAAALGACLRLYKEGEQDRIKREVKTATCLINRGPPLPVHISLCGQLGLCVAHIVGEKQFSVSVEGKDIGRFYQLKTFPATGDEEAYVREITECVESLPEHIESVHNLLDERYVLLSREADTAVQKANHCSDVIASVKQYKSLLKNEDESHD